MNHKYVTEVSDSAGYIFVGTIFSLVLKNKKSKNDHRKIYPVDLDSSRRELFIRGLGFVVALLVRWQIDILSARIGRPIQL